VAAGDSAQNLATLLEKGVRVLGQGRLLGIWDGEGVAAQDELSPETDAQREDITLSNDDAVQVGLSWVVSGILGHGFTLWRAMKLVSNVPCAPQRSAISCEHSIASRMTVALTSTARPCLMG